MMHMFPAARSVVVGVVAVGTLSLGAVGTAGAATAPITAPGAVPAATAIGSFNCSRAAKVLTRIQAGEARIAAGLPKLTAAEAAAQRDGNTRRAAHIEKRITRLESSRFKARLTRVSAAISVKCHVSAPDGSTGSAPA
jgi:hypothetical protein